MVSWLIPVFIAGERGYLRGPILYNNGNNFHKSKALQIKPLKSKVYMKYEPEYERI